MTNNNPLLDFSGLPRFSDILTEHVEPAIDQLLADAKKQLEITANTPADKATWEDTLHPLDVACEQLGRAWGVVGHLHSVADSEALRAAYNRMPAKNHRVLDHGWARRAPLCNLQGR